MAAHGIRPLSPAVDDVEIVAADPRRRDRSLKRAVVATLERMIRPAARPREPDSDPFRLRCPDVKTHGEIIAGSGAALERPRARAHCANRGGSGIARERSCRMPASGMSTQLGRLLSS